MSAATGASAAAHIRDAVTMGARENGKTSAHATAARAVERVRGPSTTASGRAAEEAVALHLAARGYTVVGRNVRTRGGEIDIVAWDAEVLVFVEVRRRRNALAALASVNARKQQRIARAAAGYVARYPRPPVCRFDVVTVDGRGMIAVHPAAFWEEA